jgi:hypothetical protein
MTEPTGSPAWTGTADATTYGGHADKRDYQAQGVVNPQTDISAAEFKRLTADIAASARTAAFSRVSVTCVDPAGPPVVTSVWQMTGRNSSGYAGDAAPTGMPSAARGGDGNVLLTWATSYEDDYGVAADLTIRGVDVSSSGGIETWEIVSANSVRVRCYNGAAAALADALFTVTVYT